MTIKTDLAVAESYIAEARYELADATRKAQTYLESADRLIRHVKAELEEDERRRTHA